MAQYWPPRACAEAREAARPAETPSRRWARPRQAALAPTTNPVESVVWLRARSRRGRESWYRLGVTRSPSRPA
ncbi:MAG: hypothetical protein WKG07_15395 [Hymenobacter sp.]